MTPIETRYYILTETLLVLSVGTGGLLIRAKLQESTLSFISVSAYGWRGSSERFASAMFCLKSVLHS